MRVDNEPAAAPFGDLDPLTRLKRYRSLLRRRWYLVAVPLLLGASLGWFSAPKAVAVNKLGSPVLLTTYYRAAHILISETQGQNGSASQTSQQPVNLAQAAYLVNTGEVPTKVAAKLGRSVNDVKTSLLGLPRTQVSSVEVQAIGTDKAYVVKLADAAAAQLLVTLRAQAKTAFDANRDRTIAQLDKLDASIKAANTKIAANPPNLAQLEAQQRSLTNQYSLEYEQFSQLADLPEPTAGLTSLEGAKATAISKAEYKRDQGTIRNGADYVTGASTTVPPSSSGSVLPSAGLSRPTRAGLGGIGGLVLGVGLVLLLDRFDSRLRRRADVEAATGLTVVAEIPPLSRQQQRTLEVVAHTQHRSRAAEAFRVVRGALMFALGSDPVRPHIEGDATVLMVTSANPAEGKTTTVANLAAVLVEGGLKVLVINCDFRRPRIHDYLLHAAPSSVAAVQPAEVVRLGSVVVTDTEIDGLRLITGIGEGDPDAVPLDVVATQRKVIALARPVFDVILLDTAPFLTTNDASELLSETDQVLLVIRSGKTRVDAARRMAEILERFEAPVLGVVMNDSDDSPGAQYYYYNYGRSGRGRGPDARSDDKPKPSSGNGRAPDLREPSAAPVD